MLTENQITKAISTPIQDTLNIKPKMQMNFIPVLTIFNNFLQPLDQIIKNRWDILKINPIIKYIYQEPVILIYRWPNNLKEMIGIVNLITMIKMKQ